MFNSVSRRKKIHGQKHRNRVLNVESLEDRQLLAAWEPAGPAPIVNGLVTKVTPNNEVSGAIHTVVAHPTNANILYLGGVNSGIWRTDNATATRPDWEPLTDEAASLSVSALAMDPTNSNVLVAGFGIMSSFSDGGSLPGLLLTEDGGANWSVIDNPLLVGRNISGLAIEGDLIIATAGSGFFELDPKPEGGLFVSRDRGATWESMELLPRTTNNPDDPVEFEVYDLVSDPTDNERYYASVAGEGVFKTEDAGATWQNTTLSDNRFDSILTFVNDVGLLENNIEMAVAPCNELDVADCDGRVYVALISVGQLVYLGYSDSQGGAWTEMDIPLTQETGGVLGLVPRIKPGGQGAIHFSIIVDPNDPKTVYLGGDRQDGDLSLPVGNSIGAKNFTGRLFRGDTREDFLGNVFDPFAAVPLIAAPFSNLGVGPNIPFNGYSPQWEHLTDSNLVFDMPEGGTRRGSAPHADSREMAFDANGDLIQTDDGGIYRRTQPQSNQGDWYSINGDLQATEIHNIAYDANANILIAGSQDNGTIQQTRSGSRVWETTPTIIGQTIANSVVRNEQGDGGDVAIDDTSLSGFSIRYTSRSGDVGLLPILKQTYDAQNRMVDEEDVSLLVDGSFTSPIELNKVDQRRMVVVGTTTVSESFDRANSFRTVTGPNQMAAGADGQNAVAYGGYRNGKANLSVLYVGTNGEVLVRTAADDDLQLTRAQFPGGTVRDIVLDTDDWATAYVIDRDNIFVTRNAGDTWNNITGDLIREGASELRSIEFIKPNGSRSVRTGGNDSKPAPVPSRIVVGTNTGIFAASVDSPRNWNELGNIPNAPVYDMEYDATDDVLVAGTLGRGAFTLNNASTNVVSAEVETVQNGATGFKWNDLNGDGVRNTGEPGIANVLIYVDINGDNLPGIGEPSDRTSSNGFYSIADIPNGNFAVREVVQTGYVQTSPTSGEHFATFSGETQVTGNFGNMVGQGTDEGFDFGDAPAPYPSASHAVVSGFGLGNTIDGESGPSGDDGDDGVSFGELLPGVQSSLNVSISNGSQTPALLQAWVDFNSDGVWTADEQIVKNGRVSEGSNSFTFDVPTTAIISTTYARVRYGYEPGLGVSGASIAGEVEDYQVSILRSGPTAVDDEFLIRRNAGQQVFQVLANDTSRLRATVTSVDQGSEGGNVAIGSNGTSILYTSALDFSGRETFTYTTTDINGASDTASVSVTVQPDLALFRLTVADTNGNLIDSVSVGDSFILQGRVQDLRDDNPTGVFAAYMDVMYQGDLAEVTGQITYSADYPNGRSGDTSEAGLIDEVGAFDGLKQLGDSEAILFSVPMRATQTGTLAFMASPADVLPLHNVLVFDNNIPVPFDQIEFRGTSLGVSNIQTVFATNTNPTNPMDVNNDNFISPIDALMVINELNTQALRAARSANAADRFTDVNADGSLSPIDALLLINYLNQPGRQVAAVAAAIDDTFATNSDTTESRLTDIEASIESQASVARPLIEVALVRDLIFSEVEEEENSKRRKVANDFGTL